MKLRTFGRIGTSLFFIAAGVNHFRRRARYLSIMPDYLPWHSLLVDLSGIAEIALGSAALTSRMQRPAGWGLIALLVAVFPANVHMALHAARYRAIPVWLLWVRLPLQGLLIAWVRWCMQPERRHPKATLHL